MQWRVDNTLKRSEDDGFEVDTGSLQDNDRYVFHLLWYIYVLLLILYLLSYTLSSRICDTESLNHFTLQDNNPEDIWAKEHR